MTYWCSRLTLPRCTPFSRAADTMSIAARVSILLSAYVMYLARKLAPLLRCKPKRLRVARERRSPNRVVGASSPLMGGPKQRREPRGWTETMGKALAPDRNNGF